MSGALTLFDTAQMPAHVSAFLEEEGGNIEERASINALSYTGKVWQISWNGEKTKLVKKDEAGDEVAVPIMRVVILGYAKERGRTYFEGAYDPNNTKQADCWSVDGKVPDASVSEPQSDKCDTCPMAAKGSKVTDAGKATTACSQHRMLAVAPAGRPDMVLRLKIAVTSDWDGDNKVNEAKGWYAFRNFLDLLKARGVPHTAILVTKMKFDDRMAYPKLLFSPDRFLDAEELEGVKPVAKSDEVKKMLSGEFSPEGADGRKVKPAAVAAPAAKPAPKPAPAPVEVEDEDEDASALLAPKKAAAPAPKPAAKKAAPVVIDDEDEAVEILPAPKTAKKAKAPDPAPKPVEASTNVPDELAELLDTWDAE